VQLFYDSPLVGVELRNAPLRSELNVIVVGVRENLRQLERMAEGG
jgi:Trk K+ transport system NAD-binding subunit